MVASGMQIARRRERWIYLGILSWLMLASISGIACLAFLWQPDSRPRLGDIDDLAIGAVVQRDLVLPATAPRHRRADTPLQVANVPIYVVRLSATEVIALSQRDPRSGCHVAWQLATREFIDPCHGSTYEQTGEYVRGPARRGLDRFPVEVNRSGEIVVTSLAATPAPLER